MTHRTAQQDADEIQFARWLYWQVLCRSPKYRRAVAEFLKSVRERRSRLIKTIESRNRRHSRLSAERRLEAWGKAYNQHYLARARDRVLETYRFIQTPRLDKTDNPVMHAIGECIRDCVRLDGAKHRPPGLARLLPGQPRNVLPELDSFSRKWGMKFPLPPSFKQILEGVFTTGAGRFHPVRIQVNASRLRLEIRLGLPKKLLLAFVDGALHHFVPHSKGWKTVSRKTLRRDPHRELIETTHLKNSLRVRIPLINSQMPFDKERVLNLLDGQIPPSNRLVRFRQSELHQMILIADHRRLDRSGRGPRPTMKQVAKVVFPKTPQVHLVREHDSTDPLPAYRLGRRGKLLVKLSEFRRWMNTLKVQPTTAPRMPRHKRQATANGIAVSTERTQNRRTRSESQER
jgi:hypothetical protein